MNIEVATNHEPPANVHHIDTIHAVVHQFGQLLKSRGSVAADSVSHVSHIKMNQDDPHRHEKQQVEPLNEHCCSW